MAQCTTWGAPDRVALVILSCKPAMLRLTLPLLLLIVPAVHTRLARSEPAAASVVTESPGALRLWFEGDVEVRFTEVVLRSRGGARIGLGAPVAADSADGLIIVPVPMLLTPDVYTVSWRTAGRDGHPITGEYAFTVAQRDGSMPPSRASSVDSTAWGAGAPGRTVAAEPIVSVGDSPFESTQSPAQYAPVTRPVRWVELSALTISLGAVALLLAVLRTARGSPAHEQFMARAASRSRAVGIMAATVFAAATFVRLVLESNTLHGSSEGATLRGLGDTLATAWGRGWSVGALAMLLVLITLIMRRPAADSAGLHSTRRGNDLALGGAALIAAVGPAVTGHAAGAAALMPLAVISDWLHVVGAGAWIGSVSVIAVAVAPAALAQPAGERVPAAAWLVTAFHALATPAIMLVLASGLLSAWLRVGSWHELTGSAYGGLLLFKVYLVAFAALLGAYHWYRVRPRLELAASADDRPARQLGWTLYVEMIVGLVVIALTAALVTTLPPR